MELPVEAVTLLTNNKFYPHSANVYNGKKRYVRYVKNITAKNITYYNCGVVVETWADSFLLVRIWGMHPSDENYDDITRDVFRSVNQFVQEYPFFTVVQQLVNRPINWANQYGF